MTAIDHLTLWGQALDILSRQMTRASYDSILKGVTVASVTPPAWTIAARSEENRQWLADRLREKIGLALAAAIGYEPELSFIVAPVRSQLAAPETASAAALVDTNGHGDMAGALAASPAVGTQAPDTLAHRIARADFVSLFFKKGGLGYSQVSHFTAQFWMQILGDAFLLWKFLDSQDSCSLDSIDPVFWSPVIEDYFYQDLAEKLGQRKARWIAGEPDECNRSRDGRTKHDRPLTSRLDCCLSPNYEWLRYKDHPARPGVLMCQHWREGRLEVLHRHHLVRVELSGPAGRKPRLQVWRMLPPLTPYQVDNFLTRQLQADYRRWLTDFGPRFGARSVEAWRAEVTEESEIPLMPGWSLSKLNDNFGEREARREFMVSASRNPNYLPCMGVNSESDEGMTQN